MCVCVCVVSRTSGFVLHARCDTCQHSLMTQHPQLTVYTGSSCAGCCSRLLLLCCGCAAVCGPDWLHV